MSWSWPLFAWGALLGPVWVAVTTVVFRLGARYVGGDGRRTQAKFAGRYPLWAASGVPVGILSAVFTTAWFDVVFSAYAVLAVLAPLAMLPKLRRVANDVACESGGTGSCASCPVACDRRDPATAVSAG